MLLLVFSHMRGEQMMVELMKGNCLDLLKKIPNDSVDLVLCDPPYGTIKDLDVGKELGKKSGHRTDWDTKLDMSKIFKEYDRILRVKGRVILFSQEPFTREIRQIRTPGIRFSYPLVWLKNSAGNPLSANKKPLNIHEDLSVYKKEYDTNMISPLRVYAKKCLDYTGYTRQEFLKALGVPVETFFIYHECLTFKLCSERFYQKVVDTFRLDKMEGFKTYEELKAMNSDNELVFNRLTDKAEYSVLKYAKDVPSYHATQKPVKLLEHIILMYTNKGETVLDNTMGSGSTGVACINTERNFIGMELDDEFYNITKQRIYDAKKNAALKFNE